MKTEDIKRYRALYENEHISKQPYNLDDCIFVTGMLNDELTDLKAKVEFLEGYSAAKEAENDELLAVLTAMLYAHGKDIEPMTTEEDCYYCGVQMMNDGEVLDYEHAPDCAWEKARRLVEGE
jgi:hypothetical protein